MPVLATIQTKDLLLKVIDINAFCVEHILKTNFMIQPKFFGHL